MASNTKVREDDARGTPPGHFGQPPHEPTPETRHQVETMAGLGMVQTDIGRVLRVSPDTLQRHYREELDRGKVLAGMSLRQRAFQIAMGQNLPQGLDPAAAHRASVPMTMFLLKTQHGFKETSRHEHADAAGGPQEAGNPAATVRERLRSIRERAEPTDDATD